MIQIIFSSLSAYIIRASFWIVLLVGLVDMILSFLRVEDYLVPLFGKDLGMALGRPNFRGTYVHFPVMLISSNYCLLIQELWVFYG